MGARARIVMAAGALLTMASCSLVFSASTSDTDGPGASDSGSADDDANPADGPIRIWSASGANHTCLSRGPRLLCWGINRFGQLGRGDFETIGDDERADEASFATTFPSEIEDVSMSYSHTCAVTAAGNLFCWGSPENGQLGYSDTQARIAMDHEAGSVLAGGFVRAVEAGEAITCIQRQRDVVCFGDKDSTIMCARPGGCATEDLGDNEHPEAISSIEINALVDELAMGKDHVCVRLDSTDLACWGTNAHGELGISTDFGGLRAFVGPIQNPNQLSRFAFGNGFGCGIDRDKHVRCWGKGEDGQLGEGNTNDLRGLEAISDIDLGFEVSKVVAGDEHVCALSTTRNVVQCWGEGRFGALGRGDNESVGDDEVVENTDQLAISGVVDVAAGADHTCVVLDTDEVVCWGLNIGDQDGGSGVLGWGPDGACNLLSAGGDEHCAYGDEDTESVSNALVLKFDI